MVLVVGSMFDVAEVARSSGVAEPVRVEGKSQSAVREEAQDARNPVAVRGHIPELPNLPYMPWSPNVAGGGMEHCGPWEFGNHRSIQVNADANGCNVVGDAANEPSIAIDPTNPNVMVIGWRQFDTINSDFRQAGYAYSHDGGTAWTFPGSLAPGTFHSDPVMQADRDGVIHYIVYSSVMNTHLFKSFDGGVTWDGPVTTLGGDKPWAAIDTTTGVGQGNLYLTWTSFFGCCPPNSFSRSIDGGTTFTAPLAVPQGPFNGTVAVGPEGEVYVGGSSQMGAFLVARSTNARDAQSSPTFDFTTSVSLDGFAGGLSTAEPNPGGLVGQIWVAVNHAAGPMQGDVYLLAPVFLSSPADPMDLKFAKSVDGGVTWSEPVRVNDDPPGSSSWQWFGMMSVAPNGRIDAAWYDTRLMGDARWSQLYYSFSHDGGETWSPNQPVSAAFDTHIGWPSNQNKIGDYCHMLSDATGVSIAYAATFNGEQDVYFLRIGANDCNSNGIPDVEDISSGTSQDCNGDQIPDECNADCNDNGIADECDVQGGGSADCDADALPDECEIDFDGDQLIDDCDPDSDNDGLTNEADLCDQSPLGIPVAGNGTPIFDFDLDCRIDLVDYGFLDNCILIGGPSDPVPSICRSRYDIDQDQDVDLADVAVFQRAFTGP